MKDPLDFPFPDYDNQPSAAATTAFATVHPGPHYVVLLVEDAEDLATLIRDTREFPNGALLTPTMENPVTATMVAVLDSWPTD